MTLSTNRLAVKVGKAATRAAIPESVAFECEGTVGADGEARGGWPLNGVVKLKLLVCNDFAGTTVLIGEDTVLQRDDGIGGANGWALGRDCIGNVVRSNLKGASVIFIAAVGSLS